MNGPALRRFTVWALALLLTVLGAPRLPDASAGATADASTRTCSGQGPKTTDVGTFKTGERPIVLVHGWTGETDAMGPVEKGLRERIKSGIDFRYFSWRDDSTTWPAKSTAPACLALYVHDVVDAAGSKAIVIAHSLGGVLTRFATNPNVVATST